MKIDDRDHLTIGEKFYEWEKKGVPVRIELGERELEAGVAGVVRRDDGQKENLSLTDVAGKIPADAGDRFRPVYLKRPEAYRSMPIFIISMITLNLNSSWKLMFRVLFFPLVRCRACEEQIKRETKATTRCMPFDLEKTPANV